MNFLKLAMLLLLASIVLACENTVSSEEQVILDSYTGNGLQVTEYLNDTGSYNNYYADSEQVRVQGIQKRELADGYEQVVIQEIVMAQPTLNPTQVNKITFILNEDNSDINNGFLAQYKGSFTPNKEYFANKEAINATGGGEIVFMFDAGVVPEGSSIGKLELWQNENYDYYDVINLYRPQDYYIEPK